MAYMDQKKKAKIAEALKKVVPAGWKYTLAVKDYCSITMTIRSAPVDLIKAFKQGQRTDNEAVTHIDVNPHHFEKHIVDPDVAAVIVDIMKALNLDNYDHSDHMSDHFNVGHYVTLQIGSWDKAFAVIEHSSAKKKSTPASASATLECQ